MKPSETIQADNLKEELLDLSNNLFANTNSRSARYFHLNSVNNFIYFFSDIKTTDDQIWVYNSLKRYFDEANVRINEIDRNIGSKLFDSHLQKIANYYASDLGFSFVLNPFYTTTIYFIIFLVLFFFFNYWVSLVAVGIYIFQMIRLAKKYKTRKVYSLFY